MMRLAEEEEEEDVMMMMSFTSWWLTQVCESKVLDIVYSLCADDSGRCVSLSLCVFYSSVCLCMSLLLCVPRDQRPHEPWAACGNDGQRSMHAGAWPFKSGGGSEGRGVPAGAAEGRSKRKDPRAQALCAHHLCLPGSTCAQFSHASTCPPPSTNSHNTAETKSPRLYSA